jgi:murein DD-endopeptidase MepM/ murein hydrolase activator NlpD
LKPLSVRLASIAVAATVAAAAIRFGGLHATWAGGDGQLRAVRPWSRTDTLGRGQSLVALLVRRGLTADDAVDAIRAATTLDERRIPAGLPVEVAGDSGNADGAGPLTVALRLAVDRLLHITRSADGWKAREERLPWTTDTLVVHGVVRTNLYQAIDDGAGALMPKAARDELTWALADVYEYRVDMSRELQPGDAVRVVFERSYLPSGAMRIGAVLAAGLERGGSELRALRYVARGTGLAGYYDPDGRSLSTAFLRAPLSFRRISSVFGMRKHPILGEWRAHKGTDYAASAGTPVRSIGDGVVVFAGTRGGYGNSIDVRHPNGFVSRYGHLRAFEAGIRAGSHVTMGQTIAFVGMTGLATAPHLHFEILVGGVQRDPTTALTASAGEALPANEFTRFARAKREADLALERPSGPVTLAAARE